MPSSLSRSPACHHQPTTSQELLSSGAAAVEFANHLCRESGREPDEAEPRAQAGPPPPGSRREPGRSVPSLSLRQVSSASPETATVLLLEFKHLTPFDPGSTKAPHPDLIPTSILVLPEMPRRRRAKPPPRQDLAAASPAQAAQDLSCHASASIEQRRGHRCLARPLTALSHRQVGSIDPKAQLQQPAAASSA